MWWVVLVVAWVGVAVLTGVVAAGREHDRVLWTVLGLVFPGAALVALLLGYPRSHTAPQRLAPDLHDALRRSRIARVLKDRPDLTEDDLAAATGLPADRVAGELRTLRMLGLVSRSRDRTWRLTPRAAAALVGDADR
jgi:DNA-binding transcriptional ArsR family regulator